MKCTLAIIVALFSASLASACSYGAAGYGSAYSVGYSAYNTFAVVAPVQSYINVAPLVTYTYQAPVTVQQYSYSQPLLSITYGQPLANVVQYQLPLAAPVQPYYSNFHSFRSLYR